VPRFVPRARVALDGGGVTTRFFPLAHASKSARAALNALTTRVSAWFGCRSSSDASLRHVGHSRLN
jgi:hypothetical protein